MRRRIALLAMLVMVGCGRCTPKPRIIKRLNDRIGGVLQKLSDEKRFDALLPSGWTIDHLGVPGDRIELGFLDKSGSPQIVELLLEPPSKGGTDGKGKVFLYRITKGGEGPGRAALLAAADLVDAATPPDAIITLTETPAEKPKPVDSAHPPGYFEPGESRTMSKAAALTVGAVESLILIAAILLSIWLPLRRTPPPKA